MTESPTQYARSSVRQIAPYVPGRSAKDLLRDHALHRVVKLASNENPLGPGARARAVLAESAELGRYPDGNGTELKAAIAELHDIGPEQVTLGNGSNDVLDLVARCFVGLGDEVVFSEYAFAVYPLVTLAAGGKARICPASGYGHDLEAMAAACGTATRLVMVANPNNPTGTWVGTKALKTFLETVPDVTVVVVDEAYAGYPEPGTVPDCVPWVADHPNLVVTRSFSKIHGLAGLRVGYAVSSPEIADLMNRVRQPFNVNTLGLAAAAAALSDHDHIAESAALNRAGLAQLAAGLNGLGLDFLPSAGNFLCVRPGPPGAAVFQGLMRRGVIVRPVDSYAMPEYLRVSVGTEAENTAFLETLADTLRNPAD